jgi:hypothetical protein
VYENWKVGDCVQRERQAEWYLVVGRDSEGNPLIVRVYNPSDEIWLLIDHIDTRVPPEPDLVQELAEFRLVKW